MDRDEVRKLAELGLTDRVIIDALGLSKDASLESLSDVLRQARGQRQAKLAELIWQMAEEKNIQVLLHLAKTELTERATDAPVLPMKVG